MIVARLSLTMPMFVGRMVMIGMRIRPAAFFRRLGCV